MYVQTLSLTLHAYTNYFFWNTVLGYLYQKLWTIYWPACIQGFEKAELSQLREEEDGDTDLGGMSSKDFSGE